MKKVETINIKETNPWFQCDTVWPRWLRITEWFVRIRIFKQKKYLIDHWRIEKSQDFAGMHSIDLEEQLIKTLTEKMNDERQ